ncbi:hypothetical protein BDF14DRAFT_757640 [Spinellus fusiger]|nr:hypothetical protein BDF14DRAFT_757640 [Spinellus fusiger]
MADYSSNDSNDSQQDGDSEGSNRPRGSDKNGRQTNHDSSASQKSFDLQQLQQYHGHYKEMTLDQATTPAANGRSLCFINPTEQSHNSTPPPPFTTNEKQMIPEYQSAEYMPSSTSQPQKSLQMLSGSSHENKEMVVSFSNPPSNPFSLSWIHGMNSPRSSSKFTVKNTPHTISNNKAMSDTNTYGPPVLEPSLHTHSPILSENQGLGNKMTESEQGTNTRDASLLLKSRHPILLYKPISHSPTKKARAYRHTNDTRPSRMTTRSSKSGSSSH